MSIYTTLLTKFPNLSWQENEPLAPFTYMKVGGPAEVLWIADSLEKLVEVLRFCQSKQINFHILGGASNIVIKDSGLDGLVIINRVAELKWLTAEEVSSIVTKDQPGQDKKQWLQVQSGIKTAVLVGATAAKQLHGLEPFLGVPGTLGGAIYNNSHYQQELIGDYVQAVEVLNSQGERQWLQAKECDFAYDHSRFQTSQEVILQVLFALSPGNPDEIKKLMQTSTQQRASTQPLGTANSGCMFKNVELTAAQAKNFDGKQKLPAGWLIDQAGLKGKQIGGAKVSTKHANFIVNTGQATSQDIEHLVDLIIKKVQQQFDITLEREVFFLGKERS